MTLLASLQGNFVFQQTQSHHRSPKLFEIRLLNLAMSNWLSVVRTLRNSENVRASIGENMQFHGKIMNFTSLTHQPWQGIYIGNSYWS